MYERFTDRARKVMQLANQEAQRFNHEYIGTEHILLGLVMQGSGVAANVLKNLDIDLNKIRQEIEKIVQPGLARVNASKPPQTPRAKKVVEYSIEEARKLNHNYVGTEHLLLGLVREEEGLAAQVLMNLGLNLEAVREEVLNLLGAGAHHTASVGVARLLTPALDAFGCDLTALARENKLDPVVGRDDEIERVLQVLGRRTRNNPLLTGEAGVGKTALAHALAQRMAADKGLRGTPFRRLAAVDFSGCAAGAEDYERFRNGVGAIINEVRRAKDVLLFLDDLHRWDYSPYAVAPLTMALTHGDVQCVAAGSVRREPTPPGPSDPLPCFATIRVAPLSKKATFGVLVALRGRYAEHHRVQITDEAMTVIVEQCDLVGEARRLPGIAVDLLDEACARVRMRAAPPPVDLKAFDHQIEELNRAKEAAVAEIDFEEAARIRDRVDKIKRERDRVAQEGRENSAEGVGVVDATVAAEVVRLRRGSAERF